ncbi:MAG: HAMP domain-containing histidine kinase [bacterium]|nr:HAMP domain-containing histidine kinase [bacterium]MCM1374127.1 HAMP domain-containing histidine kinase [Muribaculum sp.]
MKKTVSFLIFLAGASLTLCGAFGLLQNLPGDFSLRSPDTLWQTDYQQSSRFRGYISGRLETFLAMATGSLRNSYSYDSYDIYYSNEHGEIIDTRDWSQATVIQEGIGQADFFSLREPQLSVEEKVAEGYYQWQQENQAGLRGEPEDSPSEEELAERRRQLAQRYHEQIQKDKNLLYSIAYDGQVLYANSDQLPTDGSMAMPEGYNFLLCYAEGKVRIFQDGKELDVYGDGYFREDSSDWYVPGYRNFPADEEMQKAVIYMAAAREPVLYAESSSQTGYYRQMDNSLYWMQYNLLASRKFLTQNAICLAVGLSLLIVSLLLRRFRREAEAAIARFTGRLWFEAKLLLLLSPLLALFALFARYLRLNYGSALTEISYYMYEDWGYTLSYLGRTIFSVPAVPFWLPLFWLIYLTVNDLRYNKKVWRHGLIAKLYRTFTAGELRQTLAVRTAHRSGILFAAAVLYGLLMLIGSILGWYQGRNRYSYGIVTVYGMSILFFLLTTGLLIIVYQINRKNMETARDLETLSGRIRDIRNGDYRKDTSTGHEAADATPNDSIAFAGHDLDDVLTQLDDISSGMEKAVDEQMKSERMKVELIANVSHDLKTPLTSIISYVQFLKEEKNLPEHVQDYVKILDEKSKRLNNMVQDVFSVSKAASGELPMHMEELDFGKLLRQTLADMEEQIAGSSVTFRTELPDAPVPILADGQRMYRVFQNLFQNAIQYSLSGSRVFVTLSADGNLAVASVKNTSHQELEKGKDFTERFTRGDASRTDGGSGLGLSIAQSFTEACGGTFTWETNADLFVVTISFRILNTSPQSENNI